MTSLSKLNFLFSRINEVAIELIGRQLELTLEEKIIWIKLLGYLYRSDQITRYFGINCNKGILINGPIGCGKTTMFKILQRLIPIEESYLIKGCHKIALEFSIQGYHTIDHYTNRNFLGSHNLMFDDLGSEKNIRFYGNECNLLEEIISLRYDSFVNHKIKSHFTTNIVSSQIEAMYGKRIRSRLRSMVNVISFPENLADKRY